MLRQDSAGRALHTRIQMADATVKRTGPPNMGGLVFSTLLQLTMYGAKRVSAADLYLSRVQYLHDERLECGDKRILGHGKSCQVSLFVMLVWRAHCVTVEQPMPG